MNDLTSNNNDFFVEILVPPWNLSRFGFNFFFVIYIFICLLYSHRVILKNSLVTVQTKILSFSRLSSFFFLFSSFVFSSLPFLPVYLYQPKIVWLLLFFCTVKLQKRKHKKAKKRREIRHVLVVRMFYLSLSSKTRSNNKKKRERD